MTNYISFLTLAALATFLIGHSQADINCYLCSSLNYTGGGACLVPDSTTAVCTSSFASATYLGSSNALSQVLVYSAPLCWVAVYYNGNRSPFRIDRGCSLSAVPSTTPAYTVTNWVGYNISYCATTLCNTFNGAPSKFITSPSYLIMSMTSLAALLVMYSEKWMVPIKA